MPSDIRVSSGEVSSFSPVDPPPLKTEPRSVQLDVLRGLAILLVLGSHNPVSCKGTGLIFPLAYALETMGWTGVDLFFVLSGFLIGGLLFKELKGRGSLDLKRFYVRRILRIWPSYYVTLVAVFGLLLQRTHFNFSESLGILAPNLFHVQNYILDPRRPLGQSWTLAIEEHFYLVLPLLLSLLWKFRRTEATTMPSVPLVAIGLIFGCMVLRLLAFSHPHMNIFATHLRIDSLFWGVLLAYLFHFEPHKIEALTRRPALTALVGVLLVAPSLFFKREQFFMWTVGLTLLYFGYGLLLLSFLKTRVDEGVAGRMLASGTAKVVAWIGFYSYTIYLWFGIVGDKLTAALFRHIPIHNAGLNWMAQFVVFVALSALSGFVAAKLVDAPVSKIRERVFPSRIGS